MYTPKHFKIQELVPPTIFEELEEPSILLLDERVLVTLDQLRDAFGVCVVNDWSSGGVFTESGLRTPDSDIYSLTSQHSFGRAMDCKFHDFTAATVREEVIKNRLLFPWITFIEDDVDWFHFDVRNGERIALWSPNTQRTQIV